MRKLTVIMGLISLSLCSITAAGQQDNSGENGQITLQFWHLWGGTRTELLDELVQRYELDHPNVRIEPTFTASNNLKTKIVQAAGTGTLPDVFSIKSNWMKEVNGSDSLLPLDELLAESNLDINSILLENEAKRSYWNGSILSLPNVTAGGKGLFFYNKDLMRKAGLDPNRDTPANFEEFTQISKHIVNALNTNGNLEVIAWDPWQMAGPPSIIVYAYGAGLKTVSDDGSQSLYDTAEIVSVAKAFDTYVEEVYGDFGGYKALVDWYARVAGVETGSAQVGGFVQGNQVFYVSGSWTISQVKSGDPNLDFGILPVPGLNGLHGSISEHGWSYAVSAKTKNRKAAFEFLTYITLDRNGNGWFCKEQLRPCPIMSVNNDPAYQQLGELWDNIVMSMLSDIFPKSSSVHEDTVKPWLRDFPNRRIAGQTVEQIMTDVDDQYQSFLDDLYE